MAILNWLDQIKWNDQGLVPVITQEIKSNDVLMMAWMNREALSKTIELKHAVYWSRSRQKLWPKGEESGHIQWVKEIRLDCDNDVLLLKVEQVKGIACHTGRHSCFFQQLRGVDTHPFWETIETSEKAETFQDNQIIEKKDVLSDLAAVIDSRKKSDPEKSYVARLFYLGDDAILKKVGEEATEVVMAAKDWQKDCQKQKNTTENKPNKLISEVADLWFHCLVMLSYYQISPNEILQELQRREGVSGLDEKALRKSVEQEQNKI